MMYKKITLEFSFSIEKEQFVVRNGKYIFPVMSAMERIYETNTFVQLVKLNR